MEDYKEYIQQLRHDFAKQTLLETDVATNPFAQFEKWFKEAVDSKVMEAQAFHLATVSEMGQPSLRVLYLRNFDENGMVFYTNYQSKKGKEIALNALVGMNFFWPELERQIRIEGPIKKITDKESNEYFASRPKGSQVGAWASAQSSMLKDRNELDAKIKYYEDFFKNKEVERPNYWGGYVVEPHYFEFWQGRPSRLHDRITYTKDLDNWIIERLSP